MLPEENETVRVWWQFSTSVTGTRQQPCCFNRLIIVLFPRWGMKMRQLRILIYVSGLAVTSSGHIGYYSSKGGSQEVTFNLQMRIINIVIFTQTIMFTWTEPKSDDGMREVWNIYHWFNCLFWVQHQNHTVRFRKTSCFGWIELVQLHNVKKLSISSHVSAVDVSPSQHYCPHWSGIIACYVGLKTPTRKSI